MNLLSASNSNWIKFQNISLQHVLMSQRCNLGKDIGGMFLWLRCIWNSLLSFRSEEMYSGNSLAPDKGNRGFIHSNVSFYRLHKHIQNICGRSSINVGCSSFGKAIYKTDIKTVSSFVSILKSSCIIMFSFSLKIYFTLIYSLFVCLFDLRAKKGGNFIC